MPDCTPENALLPVHLAVPAALERAGVAKPKSIRLCSSLTFGNRQSPATLRSERPHCPLARLLAFDKAVAQTAGLMVLQFAFFSQIKLVRLSFPVPSPLPLKRGVGNGTPAWRSPSSPSAYDVVCPVTSTSAGLAKAGVPQTPTHAAITAAISTIPSFRMFFCIACLLSADTSGIAEFPIGTRLAQC